MKEQVCFFVDSDEDEEEISDNIVDEKETPGEEEVKLPLDESDEELDMTVDAELDELEMSVEAEMNELEKSFEAELD